jgi:transposase
MMSALSIRPYFGFARMKVIRQSVYPGSHGAVIGLAPDQRYRPRCHVCRQVAATVHSAGHRRILRDLSLADRQVFLQADYRKVWCDRCGGARVEHLSFCDAGKRVTHRLARYVYELCKMLSLEDVARHLQLNPKTVRRIDRAFLEREFGHTNYEGLRVLAIDEISRAKHQGQNAYMTVVLDYQTGRVVWMGPGRSKDTLDAFFAGMTQAQKAQIQAVAVDMWEAYINRVRHHCPHAKIVFDLFHVVQAFGRVIDEVRRSEYRRASREDQAVLKGSRYLLLRNEDTLTAPQQERLRRLLRLNKTLNTVYILKDHLRVIYRYRRRPAAQRALDHWCAMAETIDNPWMRRFIGRLRYFAYGILNHCDFAIGTSKLEGVNTRIKLIKRRAYGYTDPDYFALKIKQAFPGKEPTNLLG